ncbi:MAG: hypothetical protein QXH99_05980 [Sulfolobales archaeon]
MNYRSRILLGLSLILLTPLIILYISSIAGIEYVAPIITYFICVVLSIYVYHQLVISGIIFRMPIPLIDRSPSEAFKFFIRTGILWLIFLPLSRILGDLVKWFVTGEYVEITKGSYPLYILQLMAIGFGAGSFLSILYIQILKSKTYKGGRRRKK